jgi:hypothetical protein
MFGIAIHGGAGTLPRANMSAEAERRYRAGLKEAIDAGFAELVAGGTSMDAVTRAVVLLEDNPLFNAGKGAVFTLDGRNELDASIMDGTTLKAGAVCGVTRIRNPVTLARAVMEKSPHVMLAGAGAEEFASGQGFSFVPQSYFYTPERWQQLERIRGGDAGLSALTISHIGTVGAVAVDAQGRLAAATSTGGMTGKRYQRMREDALRRAQHRRRGARGRAGGATRPWRRGRGDRHRCARRNRHRIQFRRYVSRQPQTGRRGADRDLCLAPRFGRAWPFALGRSASRAGGRVSNGHPRWLASFAPVGREIGCRQTPVSGIVS